MDTKSSAVMEEQEQAPPPYSLAPPSADSSTPPSKDKPSTVTSHLQTHLSALPDRIRRNEQLHDTQQAESDLGLLDHLAPIVESFLTDLGAQRNTPPMATLTLVPYGAVAADAVLSGIDNMRQRKEVGRVFRVDTRPRDEKGRPRSNDHTGGSTSALSTITNSEKSGYYNNSSSSSSNNNKSHEFTDWGRWEEQPGSSSSGAAGGDGGGALLWWRDEDLARRLASYLQPARDATPTDHRSGASAAAVTTTKTTTTRTPVQAAVEQQLPAEKPRRGWGWGSRRRNNNEPSSAASPSSSSSSSSPTAPPRSAEISLAPPGEPFREGGGGRSGTVASGDVAGVPSAGHQPGGGRRARMAVTAEEVAFRRENDFGIWESTSGWAVVVTVKIDS
jgi:hypothetical protein